MKYLRRALKYFIRMAFLVVVIIGVFMAAGLVSSDINIAFRDGWRSVGMIAAILGGISLLTRISVMPPAALPSGVNSGSSGDPFSNTWSRKDMSSRKKRGRISSSASLP